jgi:CheY-like chemotaxis protein
MAKVLLVEDDPTNQDMISRRLRWEGYQVIIASDGAEAVTLAQAELPDVILLDMGLPILNGWQATKQIKGMSETSGLPIIALTAYAMTEDQADAIAAGCDEYETKPIDFARLFGKMRALIERTSKERSAS